jgi:hypothetical protein
MGDASRIQKLNHYARSVTQCAWPNCDKSDPKTFPTQRIGALCIHHAWSIHAAINELLAIDGESYWAMARRAQAERDAPELERLRRLDDERDRNETLGWVYYLRIGDRIKIGVSQDVYRRMRQYPPNAELLAVEPGDYDTELSRHRQFIGSRADGREWFHPTADLLEHIAAITAQHGEPSRFAYTFTKNTNPVTVRRPA